MTPSHVLLKQCTGGCTLLEPSCLPSKTSTKKIPVLVAKCGINQGNYRNEGKENLDKQKKMFIVAKKLEKKENKKQTDKKICYILCNITKVKVLCK